LRREEAGKLRKQGVDLLKGMKYAFLKRPENLSENQARDLNTALSKLWLASGAVEGNVLPEQSGHPRIIRLPQLRSVENCPVFRPSAAFWSRK